MMSIRPRGRVDRVTHELDLRAPATRGRAARLDGTRRQLGGQRDDGFVLVDHATRTSRQRRWSSRDGLGSAIFEWIEAFYSAFRRHGIGHLSPAEFEALHSAAEAGALSLNRTCPGNRVALRSGPLAGDG